MRISWRILDVPNKGFQRILKPLNIPAGNISWYKKWYEIHPSSGVLPTYTPFPTDTIRRHTLADSRRLDYCI